MSILARLHSRLFQLPADIMTKLAADAGYIDHPVREQTTTSAPWIVRRYCLTTAQFPHSAVGGNGGVDSVHIDPKRHTIDTDFVHLAAAVRRN